MVFQTQIPISLVPLVISIQHLYIHDKAQVYAISQKYHYELHCTSVQFGEKSALKYCFREQGIGVVEGT